ncbi:MAG TPA: hypothetical protein VGQ57_12995, partial [Polyangiaceae bacterium]|nr:hypothetical protein [Polyangiaceae bacterium]
GLYAAERALRAALAKPLERPKLVESLTLPAIAFALSCVNPEGLREPLMFLQVTASDPTFQAGIDWRPLSLSTMSPLFPILALVIVASTLLAGRRVSIWRALTCAVLFAVALAHARFVKTALVVAVPLVAGNLVALRERFAERFSRERLEQGRFALLLLATFGTSFLLFGERRLQRELGLGLDPGAYPEAACRFAREHPLPGEMLNTLDFGSYLLFCLPSHRTYIDQRAATLFTPEFSREYRRLPEDRALFVRRLREHRIDFAFVAYDPLAKALAALPDWNLVYVDDLAQLYVRAAFTGAELPSLEWLNPAYLPSLSSLHGEPRSLARAELERQRRSCPTCRVTQLFAAALGTPEETARWLATLPGSDDDPNVALLRGLVLLQHGDLPRAVDVFNGCLERSTDPIGVALWIDRALGQAGQTAQRRVLRDAVRGATAEGLAQKFALAELQGGS